MKPFLEVVHDSPQEALAAACAMPVALWGYPLVEMVRTCRIQTSAGTDNGYGRAPINVAGRSLERWTHRDRDIVTPANDLLYFSAWLSLSAAPVMIDVPAGDGRYFVIELLDAYTNNFCNLSPKTVAPGGGRYRLIGPGTPPSDALGPVATVRCPTDLVWLLGRVLVDDDEDLPAARALQARFAIDGPRIARPVCVEQWRDTGDAALDFFANLSTALAEFPPAGQEGGIASLLDGCGVRLGTQGALDRLRPRVENGLRAGFDHAMRIIDAHTRSQARKAWGWHPRLGRYGTDYLLRATTAMKGLGALSADEAIYALADFDAGGEPLRGSRCYRLHFPAGQLPAADAFWSVSLYGEDRFFVDNPIGRHAIGDRTRGLVHGADGSLTISIQHPRPSDGIENWLPAPTGAFYLILRLYHPRDEFLSGQRPLPAVERVA